MPSYLQPNQTLSMKSLFLIPLFSVVCALPGLAAEAKPIDRKALVTRHNVNLTTVDGKQWMQVGNGEFAFGADATGLQTFAGNTMAQWAWHTNPLPEGLKVEDFRLKKYEVAGREVGYATDKTGQEALFQWLRENPHRINLGNFLLLRDGGRLSPTHLSEINQTLDLWSGLILSRFVLEGQNVEVETCAHPSRDLVAIRIKSPMLDTNRLSVMIRFPYGDPGGSGGTFSKPEAHSTKMVPGEGNNVLFVRQQDQDTYYAALAWAGAAEVNEKDPHIFILQPRDGVLEFVCSFSPEKSEAPLPSFDEVKAASAQHWAQFWQKGGAIDLSESKDPRWRELERRIVLSQYLTAVNGAGSLPPQEAALVNNGWHGKFHLEMHWWHGAHFALWNRWPLFDRSLWWYRHTLPRAQERAASNGYKGAHWPKMTGPDGRNSPGGSNELLLWQQPHPIFYAEQEYRLNPSKETLDKWRDVVFSTADFLATYPVLNLKTGFYEFVQPYHTMPEDSNPPSFELGYWRYGLRTALEWKKRLGEEPNSKWQEVLSKMAPLPVEDGVYWYRNLVSHPGHIGAYGMLPGDGVDPKIMKPTVVKLMKEWQADTGWGWDFPMIAMAAARTGQPDLAIDALLHPSVKNEYSWIGNNLGSGTAYFPGNGGFLYAVAMMAAGWDGAPDKHAPGFPSDGSWTVRWENLQPAQ